MVGLLERIYAEQDERKLTPVGHVQPESQGGKHVPGKPYSPDKVHQPSDKTPLDSRKVQIRDEKIKAKSDDLHRQFKERTRFAYRYDPRLAECTCCKVESGPCKTPSGKVKPEGNFHMVRRIKAFEQGWAVWKEGYTPDERPGPDNVRRH